MSKDSGGRVARYGIFERFPVKRGSLDLGTAPVWGYRPDPHFKETFPTRLEAKAAFMRYADPELAGTDDRFAASHFDAQQRNEAFWKVRRVDRG